LKGASWSHKKFAPRKPGESGSGKKNLLIAARCLGPKEKKKHPPTKKKKKNKKKKKTKNTKTNNTQSMLETRKESIRMGRRAKGKGIRKGRKGPAGNDYRT